jgi:hypothetical protein
MMVGEPGSESGPLVVIRKALLAALALGIVGTGAELILLGHFDDAAQWIPLVGCGVAVPLLLWHTLTPSRATVVALRALMAAFVFSGVIGVGLHYSGNVEFERERDPRGGGWPFVKNSLAGATPVLAPGSMVLLGLVGLAQVYRHPASGRRPG